MPSDPAFCTLNYTLLANKCPFIMCVNDNECSSLDCDYMNDMDANGVCDTIDSDHCYTYPAYQFNLCNKVNCTRDSQCASITCGQNGVCTDYNYDDNNGGDSIDWEEVVVGALIVIGVLGLLIGCCIVMKKRRAARL